MRILLLISVVSALLVFAACWLLFKDRKVVPELSHHPVGAVYEVSGDGISPHQVTVYFNGYGRARVMEGPPTLKLVIDYANHILTTADFTKKTVSAEGLDPLRFPVVMDRDGALSHGAKPLGEGTEKAFPYQKWRFKYADAECEVWTDNHDRFPVFYSADLGSRWVKWKTVNSWIDGAAGDKPAFFSSDTEYGFPLPDPKAANPDAAAGGLDPAEQSPSKEGEAPATHHKSSHGEHPVEHDAEEAIHHKTRSADRKDPSADLKVQSAKHKDRNPDRKDLGTDHKDQSLDHKDQSVDHKARSAVHKDRHSDREAVTKDR